MTVRHPIPRTPAQVEAITLLVRRHAAFRVGWHCTPEEIVRGALYLTIEDDENGRSCAEFSVYPDGEVQWWREPPPDDREVSYQDTKGEA